MQMKRLFPAMSGLIMALAACSGAADVPQTGFGPNPQIPEPNKKLIPTVNVAPAAPWAKGEKPIAAQGFAVSDYADGLDHPRWLYALPNGDILVAETNAPPKPEDKAGVKGFFMEREMKKAGAVTPSANRITLLHDAKGDGTNVTKSVFLENLNSPFGMALIGQNLYVADSDAVLRFPYHDGETKIMAKGVKLLDLPAGLINHHWTKNIIASPDGAHLYVTIGSNSNAAENGIEKETGRADIWEVDPKTGASHVFASGLRNPNGMGWQPQTGTLWVAVNERDELGDNLVPDYMTSVQPGGFYGWPYSYWGQHVDTRVTPQRPDMVAKAIKPDYGLGNHTASLGLTFYTADLFPDRYKNGAFIGQHGSWNRKPMSGYKVVFVPFANGKPNGMPEDILSGFLDEKGNARGRPVGVAVDGKGALLVADDVGNTIWRVTANK